MTLVPALLAFVAAASLLTVTPGLDVAMVLRTAAVEGPRRAAMAALGIGAGCLVWGAAMALGLAVLLTASAVAYTAVKWAGAAYLLWLGANLILKPRATFDLGKASASGGSNWFARGLMTNLLNPKIGVFYVSFLPQFVPVGFAPAPFIMLLASIHVLLHLAWSACLILATTPLKAWLQSPGRVRWLDRLTGGVFVGFGLKLAFERR